VRNDEVEALRRQMFDAMSPAALAAPNQQGSLAEAFGRGSSTLSGQGSNATFGGNAAPNAASNTRAVGTGLSAIGVLSQNPELAQFGSMVGLGGALGQAKTPQQALATMAGPVAGMLGVPGSAIGFGSAALNGNVAGMVNSALSLNPTVAALNALSGVMGLGTVGGVVAGTPGAFQKDGSYEPGTPGLLSTLNPNFGYGGSYSGMNQGVDGSYANPGLGSMASVPSRNTGGGSGGSIGGYGKGAGSMGGYGGGGVGGPSSQGGF
jgi:hypothetical protein